MENIENITITGSSAESQMEATRDLIYNIAKKIEEFCNNITIKTVYTKATKPTVLMQINESDVYVAIQAQTVSGVNISISNAEFPADTATDVINVGASGNYITTQLISIATKADGKVYKAETTIKILHNSQNAVFTINGKIVLSQEKMSNDTFRYVQGVENTKAVEDSNNIQYTFGFAPSGVRMLGEKEIFLCSLRLMISDGTQINKICEEYFNGLYSVVGNSIAAGSIYIIDDKKYYALSENVMFCLTEEGE